MLGTQWSRRAGRTAAITVALAVLAAVPPARAQAPAATEAVEPVDLATVVPVETTEIDPVLDALEVEETPAIRRAEEDLKDAAVEQNRLTLVWIQATQRRTELLGRAGRAEQSVAAAQQAVADAGRERARQEDRLEERKATEAVLRAALAEQQEILRDVAAAVFTHAPLDDYAAFGGFGDYTEADRRDAGRAQGVELQSEAVEAARAPWTEARAERRAQQRAVDAAVATEEAALGELRAAIDERDRFAELLAAAEAEARRAQGDLTDATDRSREVLVERRRARLTATAAEVDVPLVALHAYWRAAQLAPCRIPWWVIAGVGRVETRHGSAFGSELTPEGDTTVHIIGMRLDGRPGTAAIADTDGGRLDDDPTWDRAVGPMQFIPGTWARWATDANADEAADPHNIYDAAGAAASYLCFRRGDLDTEAKLREALLSYNRSVPYGDKVLAEGGRYLEALDLPELPPRADDPDPERDDG